MLRFSPLRAYDSESRATFAGRPVFSDETRPTARHRNSARVPLREERQFSIDPKSALV